MSVMDVCNSTQKTHLDVVVVVTVAALLQGSWLGAPVCCGMCLAAVVFVTIDLDRIAFDWIHYAYSDRLFPTHFKQLYPGHPNLDSYIFGGGGNAHDSSALQQVLRGSFAYAGP